jgi:hypothetical protein
VSKLEVKLSFSVCEVHNVVRSPTALAEQSALPFRINPFPEDPDSWLLAMPWSPEETRKSILRRSPAFVRLPLLLGSDKARTQVRSSGFTPSYPFNELPNCRGAPLLRKIRLQRRPPVNTPQLALRLPNASGESKRMR